MNGGLNKNLYLLLSVCTGLCCSAQDIVCIIFSCAISEISSQHRCQRWCRLLAGTNDVINAPQLVLVIETICLYLISKQ